MANTLKFGSGQWATKVGSTLAYNDEGGNFKPLPFNFTRSTGGTRVNKDGLIEMVTNNKPRIDYLNDSNGVLLLEPQRTNLLLRSEEFDNASWVKLGQGTGSVPIVTPNYAISPDGTQNASRLQCDLNGGNTTSDRSWLYQSITDVVVESTFSLYVKNISSETIIFTLNNGSSGTVSVPADSQWHRLYSVKTGGAQPRIGLIGGVGASDNADLLIWGSQIEAGSYATSYIPTQGAISTRVDDACSQTTPSGIIGQTEGTLFVNAKLVSNTSSVFCLHENTTNNNRILILYNSTANQITFYIEKAGVIQVNSTFSTPLLSNSFVKCAFVYNTNNCAFFINGIKVGTDIVCETFTGTTISRLSLSNATGSSPFVGDLKNLQLYNTALTDAELINLTTI